MSLKDLERHFLLEENSHLMFSVIKFSVREVNQRLKGILQCHSVITLYDRQPMSHHPAQ